MLRKIQFRVVHVTSQDEEYPAKELNHISPNTKGWRSAKNCPYPQQIVIELEKPSRIRTIQILSHQFLIASKVEFFVGDSYGDDTINMDTSRFHRLGHVELSNNENTNFTARELKSVHVDAQGLYFQIFLYKNFANTENIYNQISVIALNFIGGMGNVSATDFLSNESMAESFKNISPLDDLAFDIYQDPHLGDIIRRLQHQKLKYARQENFDLAKKARDAIRYIQDASERICRLEYEKREAVELENYEEAQEKKDKIAQIRNEMTQNIDLEPLLNDGSRHKSGFGRPRLSGNSPTIPQNSEQTSTEVEANASQRPISSDLARRSEDALPLHSLRNVADERPLPALVRKQTSNGSSEVPCFADNDQLSKQIDEDFPVCLSEATLRKAAVAIDVVGLPLVTMLYSRSWKIREQALIDLEKRVSGDILPPPSALESMSSDPDPVGELRSTTFLLRKALNEQVLNVYRKALELIQPTIVDFGERHRIAKSEIFTSIDKIVRLLLQRTGDSSVRIRDFTKAKLVEMAKWPIFRQGGGFWHEILRPFHQTTLERLALCQIEVVSDIYAEFGNLLNKTEARNGFPLIDDLITFAVQALEHRSNEVRELAESLIIALYRSEDKNLVRQHMPPNDWGAQRHPLYRRIFAKFDKLDGRDHPSAVLLSNAAPQKKGDEQALTKLQNRDRGKLLSSPPKGTTTLQKPSNKSSVEITSPTATTNELDLLLSLDKTCIFCGEQNDAFTEEALDIHYWKSCPMLRRCPNCKQVVEISGLTEHLLNECPESSKLGHYRRCERCGEAVPNASFITHNSCEATPNPSLRCPLCHMDLPDDGIPGSNNEDSWRTHLLEECRQNSRIVRSIPQPSGLSTHGPSVSQTFMFPGKKAVVKRVNVR